MKLLMVTPRYGAEVFGGAEQAARRLAERLVALADWEVEVATSTARDHLSWANYYPAGEERLGGVRVVRYPVRSGRHPDFDRIASACFVAPWALNEEEGARLVRLQGPYCPELIDAVASSDADAIAFYPYLYHPSLAGVPLVAERAILHPAAHDEPMLQLSCFDRVFRSATALCLQTHAEARLVARRFGVGASRQQVLGLGIDGPEAVLEADILRAREELGLGDHPYFAYLGRVDRLKGAHLLARCFGAYADAQLGDEILVLAGPVAEEVPAHPRVVVTGPIPEDLKWGFLAGAVAFVCASALEAFCQVVVEAMAVGVPVLVNAACGATSEHVSASGAGLRFFDLASFVAAAKRLASDPALRAEMARNGLEYARRFRWPTVVAGYSKLVAEALGL